MTGPTSRCSSPWFAEVTATEEQIIRLAGLGPQLRLEIGYALQCRRDRPATKTFPSVVMLLVRALAVCAWLGVVLLVARHSPETPTRMAVLLLMTQLLARLAEATSRKE